MIPTDYQFLFVGGSCGSFVKNIFAYYLLSKRTKIELTLNADHGDAHGGNNPLQHYHYIESIDRNKPVIAIDFDEDDLATIVKMVFHKNTYREILNNPNLLNVNWFGKLKHIDVHDATSMEQVFLSEPNLLVFQDWSKNLSTINPVLTINFKQILFGDLHKIITDFLQVNPLLEIDEYIEQYRASNKKYLTYKGCTYNKICYNEL